MMISTRTALIFTVHLISANLFLKTDNTADIRIVSTSTLHIKLPTSKQQQKILFIVTKKGT